MRAMTDWKTIRIALREMRAGAGFENAGQLAVVSGIPPATAYRLEDPSVEGAITLENLELWVSACGSNLSDFFRHVAPSTDKDVHNCTENPLAEVHSGLTVGARGFTKVSQTRQPPSDPLGAIDARPDSVQTARDFDSAAVYDILDTFESLAPAIVGIGSELQLLVGRVRSRLAGEPHPQVSESRLDASPRRSRVDSDAG